MKANPRLALLMLSLFTLSQLVGFWVNSYYQDLGELPYGMQHSEFEKQNPVLSILTYIAIGTIAFLVIIKFKFWRAWKAWFFLAMTSTLAVFLYAFLDPWLAITAAGVLAFIRLFERDQHYANLTNLLMFSTLGALFSTIFNPFTITVFLLIISAYDFVSVFMTKHMVTIAKGTKRKKLFPGLVINWRGETLVLGGGDVALPIIFQAVILSSHGAVAAFFTIYGAIVGLGTLLYFGRKKKFYPAMPFITAGLLAGYWASTLL